MSIFTIKYIKEEAPSIFFTFRPDLYIAGSSNIT